jgi:hypothetical protein
MAAEASVIHRALDGHRFRLSGPLDLALPFTSAVGVVVHGHLHELTAGPPGLGEEVARAAGVDRLDEELSYRGGTLRLGHVKRYDAGIRLVENLVVAVWQGRRYSLVLQLYRASTADVLGLLRTFEIVEHDDGIEIRPDAKAGSSFAGPASVVKQVPGLGLLEVSPLTAQHTKTLPAWQGISTRAGELFQDGLANGQPYFVIAGTDTWGTVVPLADTAVGQLPAMADRLTLQTVG